MSEIIDHPLNHDWVMWEHRTGESNYKDNLGEIASFSTVEDFWKLVQHIPFPSHFFQFRGANREQVGKRNVVGFSFFHKHVQPCWEDPKNINGGEWRIRKFKNLDEVDSVWKDIVLCLIGEDHNNLKIVGARVVDSSNEAKKKIMYNVEVWFEDLNERNAVEQLLLDKTGIDPGKLFFRVHSDAQEKTNLGLTSNDNIKVTQPHNNRNGNPRRYPKRTRENN